MCYENAEKRILEKFRTVSEIRNEQEMKVMRKWAGGGLVKFGTDFKTLKAEATLTKRGKWLLPVLFLYVFVKEDKNV